MGYLGHSVCTWLLCSILGASFEGVGKSYEKGKGSVQQKQSHLPFGKIKHRAGLVHLQTIFTDRMKQ